jgi:hypothetical protein
MLLISKNYAVLPKRPEDFGCKQMSFKFQDDKVDLIVISKKGEQKIIKPLLFFCQGSLPQPLIIYNENGLHDSLPFQETPFLDQFHIAIVGKPGIPIISHSNALSKDFMHFKDIENEIPPKTYVDRNYLDYYVFRNNFIIKQLRKEYWVDKTQIVVAGHAEGSSIAAKMASLNPKITQLIYSGGNPYGRITTLLGQETNKNELINYWKRVVQNAHTINYNAGVTYKAIYSFSLPQRDNLLQLKIPVLYTYSSKDSASAFNDMFQIDIIREKKQNFNVFIHDDLEPDFLGISKNNPLNCITKNGQNVAEKWMGWLNEFS